MTCAICGQPSTTPAGSGEPSARLCLRHFGAWLESYEGPRGHLADFVRRVRAEEFHTVEGPKR